MVESGNEPVNPYEPEHEESKSERLRNLQKNRFHTPAFEDVNNGMQNMNISPDAGSSINMANVPTDMHIEGKSSGYPAGGNEVQNIPSSYGSNNDVALWKPKRFLNEESVRRGVVGQYSTNSFEIPPSSTMQYQGVDLGCASPKLIRSTMYRIPQSSSMHQSSKIPMGLIVQPMADIAEGESELPLAGWGIEGPVRCNVCGGYVNPLTNFMENGSKAKCNFWGAIFPVNDTKYSFVTDRSTLPELYYGSYEFPVSGKYVYYEVKNPTYVFILDISHEAFQNGFFASTIYWIQNTLDSIPNPDNTSIWILTVDEYVQCYQVPDDLEKGPITHQIWDLHDPFLPVPVESLMMNLSTDREKIDVLLQKLTEIHTIEESKFKSIALNLSSAFLLAYEILENRGGRVLSFYTRIENVGPGINVVVDNHKLYNTDTEKNLFKPGMGFYYDLSKKMFQKRITVDLFCGTFHALNLPNPTQLWVSTGGDLYYYKGFNEKYDSEKLHYDVFRVLTRNGAYDVAFRVRCSEGYAVVAYVGNFIRINAIDFELPSIDADKTIGVIMRSEGTVNTDKLSVQAAMLYTTPDGERKLRIMNLYLPVVNNLSNILRYVDQETLVQLSIKDSLSFIGTKKISAIKEQLIESWAKFLSSDNFYYSWLYSLAAIKSPAFKLMGEIKVDEKYYFALKLLGASIPRLLKIIWPRIYKLTDIESNLTYGYPDEETGKIIKPPVWENDYSNLGVYDLCIIDNGEYISLYVGKAVPITLIYDIFGYEDWSSLHHYGVNNLDVQMETDSYTRIINIIEQLRSENDGSYQPIQVILEGSIKHKRLKMYALFEDSCDKQREFNYLDFMNHIKNKAKKL